MAIIASDNFNRPDNPTSLGTATTGQVWSQVSGSPATFGISSNQALWSWDNPDPSTSQVVIETGFTDAITKATLVDPDALPNSFAVAMGIVFRYLDSNNFWQLLYLKSGFNLLFLQRTLSGSTVGMHAEALTLNPGDSISCGYCDRTFNVFVNDVLLFTVEDILSPTAYGTKCGLTGNSGTYFLPLTRLWDDFSVETNGTCTPTYNCTEAGCVDPEDGTGTYATLAACLVGCGDIPVTYNCVDGTCVDPGDGSGDFATLLECQNSGCSIPPIPGIGSERFDSGNGTAYYVVPQIDDSGEELRSKTIKAGYVVGKKTNASIQFYGWDVKQEINMTELEDGTRINGSTAPQALPDSTDVTQSKRQPVNVKNAVVHSVRVAGDCTGEEVMDRLDSICYEVAEEGVRR